jgi:ABC-type transport system involved in multi-copper enzyme maturation permease subunit
MITTKVMELRKRRGLMIALIALSTGFPAVFLLIRLLAHAFAPRANPPAGGDQIFVVLVAGFLPLFGFIVATTVGCTAGSRDLTEGMFRHLVVTGRSRLALYLARIPAGLAIIVPLVAIGYMIVCAVCVFAAPAFIDDNNVNIPPGLSRAGFENWARDHAGPVICGLPYNGHIPGDVTCAGPPDWSKSAVTPGQPAPAAVEALAVKIAKHDYSGQNGYTGILRSPPISLMIKAGLWIELEATAAFVLGLGLASLMGQRTGPIIVLIVLQMIVTPILASVNIPHLQDLQRSVVGVAVARLEPSALPMALGLPGVAGGIGRPGSAQGQLPGSATQAVCVIIVWLAAWTILGAWRMMTRDA